MPSVSYAYLHDMETEETDSLTIRLPKNTKDALEAMAKSQDLTVSQLCRRFFTSLSPSTGSPQSAGGPTCPGVCCSPAPAVPPCPPPGGTITTKTTVWTRPPVDARPSAPGPTSCVAHPSHRVKPVRPVTPQIERLVIPAHPAISAVKAAGLAHVPRKGRALK